MDKNEKIEELFKDIEKRLEYLIDEDIVVKDKGIYRLKTNKEIQKELDNIKKNV